MKSSAAVTRASADNAAELVGRMRSGDASAWRDLVDQYEPLLRWLARNHRLSAEDADDAVQFTWFRCLEHIDQLAHPNRLRAWLITICRRQSVRLATRRWREVPLDGPEMERLIGQQAEEPDPFVEAVRRYEQDLLYSAIADLPQRQRALIIELLKQEGLSYLNLSHHLNVPVGSLGPTRQRALTRLRAAGDRRVSYQHADRASRQGEPAVGPHGPIMPRLRTPDQASAPLRGRDLRHPCDTPAADIGQLSEVPAARHAPLSA
jgi:RNA polymerase sigma factor (sigma-70 family)